MRTSSLVPEFVYSVVGSFELSMVHISVTYLPIRWRLYPRDKCSNHRISPHKFIFILIQVEKKRKKKKRKKIKKSGSQDGSKIDINKIFSAILNKNQKCCRLSGETNLIAIHVQLNSVHVAV